MGHAGAEEALGHGLQHDPHADVDLAKRGEIPLPHDSGIGVGQEPGFLQDEPGNFAEVVEGAPMSHPTEKVAMLGEEGLGLVAQREERFLGPEALARAGEGQDLLGSHGESAGLARVAPERAIAAVVAAQGGQRDEDFGREGEAPPASAVSRRRGGSQELGEPSLRSVEEGDRLIRGGRGSAQHALEGV